MIWKTVHGPLWQNTRNGRGDGGQWYAYYLLAEKGKKKYLSSKRYDDKYQNVANSITKLVEYLKGSRRIRGEEYAKGSRDS